MESLSRLHLIRVLALLVTTIECTISLELLELRVPGHVPLGTRASLSCRWQLGAHDVLYSVKWYKDGKEFFRNVPRDIQPRRKFPLPGVDVESYNSSGGDLTLAPAVLATEGRYRCEVSGERPLFLTVSEHADLVVFVLPEEGPVLTGLLPRYSPGNHIQVNCSSGLSHPATRLSWYINGQPAPAKNVLPPILEPHEELIRTSVMLDFVVKESDFAKNGLKVKESDSFVDVLSEKHRNIVIPLSDLTNTETNINTASTSGIIYFETQTRQCLATLPPLYWRSNEESALKVRTIHERLLQASPDAGTSVRDFRATRADRVLDNRGMPASYRSNDFALLIYVFCTFLVN